MYMCLYVCVYACVCVCICVYTCVCDHFCTSTLFTTDRRIKESVKRWTNLLSRAVLCFSQDSVLLSKQFACGFLLPRPPLPSPPPLPHPPLVTHPFFWVLETDLLPCADREHTMPQSYFFFRKHCFLTFLSVHGFILIKTLVPSPPLTIQRDFLLHSFCGR